MSISIHVSPLGHDHNPGTIDAPLATLTRAQRLVRDMKNAGPVTVTVHAGEYQLTEPLIFTAADSGTIEAPILYRVAEGEHVRLTGGVRITHWQNVEDATTRSRLPTEARDQVMQADLRAHGVSDFGVMESAPAWAHSDPGLEVFFREQPMTLARYPNEGFLHIAALSVDDGHKIHEWRKGSKVGRFRIDGERERLQRWAKEPNVVLHGYWFWDWADQRLAVQNIAPQTGEITLDDRQPHVYGYHAGQWFYAFNLLCELDQPGEWYLDRQTGMLYFWPPTADIGPRDVVVSVLRDPIRFDQASHITLEGFTIESVRGTTIGVTGGQAVRIVGCTMCNVGSAAIRIIGGSQHSVRDCDIYQTGDGGIHLEGGDRITLTPGHHEAVNNHIHHIARWNPLYKVAIQLKGCGNRAAHNRIHDIPHTAIGFTDNDQTVEYNEIYRAVTGANDAGAIYTSGSHPEDWSMRGHHVRFNFLHHMNGFAGEGCSGIYLDDMFSGTEIHGNLLWRVSQGFLLGGGRDIVSTNNLFIDCPRAISLDARAIGWAAPFLGDVFAGLQKMPYRKKPWSSRYPELVDILQDEPALPKGNVIARNIVRGGSGIWIEEGAKPGVRMEHNLDQHDPCFVDQSKADWRLRENSPALALGFQPLPLDRIGLHLSDRRKRLPLRQLFEAELVVDPLPVLRLGRPSRPGTIRLRVRNLGDASASATLRLRVRGGRLENPEPLTCSLAPYAADEKCFSVWAQSNRMHIEAVQEVVAGVLDAMTFEAPDEALTPWPATLNISALQPGSGRLDTLHHVPPADLLHWRTHQLESASGFCNLHHQLANVAPNDAVIWIGCKVRCVEPMRGVILLGYDGPLKLFINGTAVFHDPLGTNPAKPDAAAPEFALSAGDHDLAIALGSNQGRAWGVYFRMRRDDGPALATIELPQIHTAL